MPSVAEEPRPLRRKMRHRPCLSRTTITVFVMLVTMAVLCQGAKGGVLIRLENQTVVVDGEAVFFCQVLGEKGQIWLNRISITDNPKTWPVDVRPIFLPLPAEQDSLRITNITLTVINASVQRNNSEVICTDQLLGIASGSYAYLTIQGGPGVPEVGYEVDRDEKEIVLSWPHPFTWEGYPITGYDIVCRETESEKIVDDVTLSDTNILNEPVVSHTVDLPPHIPDCYTLQCTVTASNALDQSNISITDIYFPKKLVEGHTNLSVTLRPLRFTSTSKPEAVFCVKLPVLCVFQRVRYSVVISHGGDPVLELSREFSYSEDDPSDCIQETVSGELEEGTEYEVQVFLYAGKSGNFSTNKTTFKPVLQLGLQTEDEEFFQTLMGKIVAVGVGILLVIIILILISTIIFISCKRGRRFRHVVRAPIKRTPTSMVDNPIYIGDSHSPYYEQVPPLPKRLNSTSSHTNLDSPGQRIPSPTHSAITSASTHPLYRNGSVPGSPTSTYSSNVFSWPYAVARQTSAASFEAIQADVESRMAANQAFPSCTPGEDSYMTMHSAANNLKNVNEQNPQGQPRYAIDIHGNRYIEC